MPVPFQIPGSHLCAPRNDVWGACHMNKIVLALLLGTAGGGLFALFGAPLAWLLGAMIVTTVATLSGARPEIPAPLRTVMIAVLGIMLGSAFSPDLVDRLAGWSAGVAIMAGVIIILMVVGIAYLRLVARYDPVTAYYSAAPGGITSMSLIGASLGADLRVVSLGHATRILVVVSTIPVWYRLVDHVAVPVVPNAGVALMATSLEDAATLVLLGVIGVPLAHLARIPTPGLTGPMIVSAAAHLLGWVEIGPPNELVAAAQVVVGTAIGCRFVGMAWREVRTIMAHAAIVCLLYVGVAALAAALTAEWAGVSSTAMVLALSPGGLAEMSLIALAIGIETAFVSSMHIIRIMGIILLAPVAYRLMARFT